MTTASNTAATTSFLPAENATIAAGSHPLSREVHRLADTLLSGLSGAPARCLLMMDVGGARRSSLWLTTSVASNLMERLGTPVHVLSLETAAPRPSERSTWSADGRGCDPEFMAPSIGGNGVGRLVERLNTFRGANEPVLLHSSRDEGLATCLLSTGNLDGVVLLVRASRTRRAVLQTAVQRLNLAGVPLLGCVLLDRTYPVPEKLYHLL